MSSKTRRSSMVAGFAAVILAAGSAFAPSSVAQEPPAPVTSLGAPATNPASITSAGAPTRFARLLGLAVADGVLTREKADRLEEEWSALRIGDLARDSDVTSGLVQLSRERGWLTPAESDALAARAASGVRADEPGEAVSWLSRIVSLLPWIGGIALAVGATLLVGKWLIDFPRSVQALASGLGSAALLVGAFELTVLSWTKAAEILSVAGALGLFGTFYLVCDWLRVQPRERLIASLFALAWSALACALTSSAVAALAAAAIGYLIGRDFLFDWLEPRPQGKATSLAITGVCLVGLGYAALFTPLRLTLGTTPRDTLVLRILVRPFWSIGAVTLLASAGVSWDWKEWLSPSRLWTLVLGVALVGGGVASSEGLFIGAGGLALVAWAFIMLWDSKNLPAAFELRILLTGLLTLGLAAGLDRHWALAVELLSLRSF